MKHRLSKSKIIEWHDICSWKYKLQNIDKIREPKTPFSFYADEGNAFHEGVVHFFTRLNPFKQKLDMEEVKLVMSCKEQFVENFVDKFVKPILLNSCKNNPKYYFPVIQEEKLFNVEYNFSGIADAVFVNPLDDEYVLLDWKTGKIKPREEMVEELSAYKFIIDEAGLLDKPIKYGSIFYVKFGKLFLEELKDEDVEKYKQKIKQTNEEIDKGNFKKNPKSCFFCGYSQKYSGGICDN